MLYMWPKSADKPGSVPLAASAVRGGDHLSGTMVTHHL